MTARYCAQCGADATPRACRRCRAALGPGARFCHHCGAPAVAGADRRTRNAWIVALALVVIALVLGIRLARQPPEPQAALPPPPGAEIAGPVRPAPDISRLTPRERFDRLYQRTVDSDLAGDRSAMLALADHALGAYAQLASVDAEARYQAADLHARGGSYAAAGALADSILGAEPGNLLGLMVRAKVAELQEDSASLRRVKQAFLEAWPREGAFSRTEYLNHREALEQFHRSASGGLGNRPRVP